MPGGVRDTNPTGHQQSPRRPSNRSPKGNNTSSTPIATTPTTNSDVYRDTAAVNAAVPKIINTYLPRIAAIVGLPTPTDIKFRVIPANKMNADTGTPTQTIGLATTDGTILLNEDYVVGATQSQLEALVAHEMTHEFLRGLHEGAQGPAKVFVEGLADYVRDALIQNSPDAQTPQRGEHFQNPEGGYQGGAGLFQWLEGRTPGTVKAIIASLEQGDETPLISVTGKSFPDLVDEYHNDVSVTRQENKQNRQQANAQYKEAWHNWVQAPSGPFPQYPSTGTYAGMVDNPTDPQHLGPHYAAGPNPGISVVEAAATPTQSYSPISGLLANGKTIGFDVPKPQPMGGPPAPPTIGNPNGGGSGSGSGSGSSGSGSGSSSSGSSSSGSASSTPAAPPVDPRIAQLESLFRSAYIQLWAEPPTEAYIKQAAQSGMNTTEFVHRERMKNDWQFTKAYKDEAKGLFDVIRQIGVA